MTTEKTIVVNGRRLAVRVEPDDTGDSPWESEDGHGPVSNWEWRNKKPGEMLLSKDRHLSRFYDFAAAVEIAKRDSWGAEGSTPNERAANAALADYRRLKAWCDGDWHYVAITVAPLCDCCGTPRWKEGRSIGGVESDQPEAIEELTQELARELHP